MEFDFKSDTSEEDPTEETGLEERRYAEDDNDNDFIKRLVSVTERCIAYDLILQKETSQRELLARAQSHVDCLNDKYRRMAACRLNIVHDMVEEKALELEEDEERFEAVKDVLEHCVQRSRDCLSQRNRELKALYSVSQRFLDQYIARGDATAPGLGIDRELCMKLATFMAQARIVSETERAAIESRRRVLNNRAAVPGSTPAALRKNRRQALTAYHDVSAQLERQRKNQIDSEQLFFTQTIQPLLRDAGILPDRRESVSSTSSGGLSIVQRPSHHPAEDSNDEQSQDAGSPELRDILAKKAALSEAVVLLDRLREDYVEDLAEFLIAFSNQTRAAFDVLWAQEHDGYLYEDLRRGGQAAVNAAEDAYEEALCAAEKAGLTPLPPSPRDTGNRSEDGAAGSENAVVWAARERRKNKPETRAWIKKVARSGSPISPSTAPVRPRGGVSKVSKGNVRPNWGFIGESEPKRTRVDRYEKHRKAMGKKFEEMEKERVRREGVRAAAAAAPAAPSPAPAPAIVEPQRGGWWCGVQ